MNMKLLSFVTPPSIYHGCYTQKTLWEEKFTPVNMKHFCHCNVRKHRDIQCGEKCITLVISFIFGSMENISAIRLTPQMMLTSAVNEIFGDATSGKA